MKPVIDSHVHLDLIQEAHPQRIQWLCDHDCTVISWAFGRKIGSVRDLQTYLAGQRDMVQRIRSQTDLVCNTDSGTQFYEDLIRTAGAGGLAEKVKTAVLHDSAAAFFGIEPPAHQLPLP